MTTRCHHSGTHAAVADGAVQRLLADTELTRRLARADQLVRAFATRQAALESPNILRQEAAMAARRDQRRLEQPPRDGAENRRSADTKALC